MSPLLNLLIFGVIFATVAYAIHWLCVKFHAPLPIMWIAGAVLIIILLLFLGQQAGLPSLR